MKKSIYKIISCVFAFSFLLMVEKSFAQKQKTDFFSQPEIYNGIINPIVCPAGTINGNWRIPAPASYYASKNKSGEKSATFVVTYNGFSPEAQAAFQKAVDIWESILQSDVNIYVTANWTSLGAGVLGSAAPTAYYRNGPFPNLNTLYPIALAEKLNGKHLNSIGAADINCNFNSIFGSWYLGLDGNTPAGKYDFVSVVLHELGHGLGFIDGTNFSNGVGGFSNLPFVYDRFMENTSGQAITNSSIFPNNSTAFGSALISPLFFKSPILSINNGNQRATLYSPPAFSAGSSTSHLDQDTYEGTINGLMSPQASPGVSEFDPGPIMLSMFADMGWVHTYIKPDTIKSTETVTASTTIKAKVVSDSVLNVGSIKLHFSSDSFKLNKQSVVMTATNVANQYSGVIPTPNSGKAYAYYISAKDNTTRTYFSPSEAENTIYAPFRYFYFYMGTDNTPPTIAHESITELPIAVTDTTILAEVTDVFGVDTVYVEYQINNVVKPSFGLRLVPNEFNVYSGKFQFPTGTVSANDIVKYKIVAKDNSNAKNTAFSPASGFHQFTVIGNSAIQDTYSNNFNTASNDFFGSYYSITTPSGFANAAIHTKHPYDNGSGANNESNYIYQFKIPIRVAAENTFMKFKEIALVEPGEPGSVFGTDEFYDYVIVEGSKDNGLTWKILLNGYDCRAQSVWNNRWISGADANGNSLSLGDPTLYKDRSINLKPTFSTNDVILLRFRLFADQGAYGWGWAIDDLEIQTPVAGLENLLDGDKLVKVYPNPTREILNIDTEFKFAVKKVEVQVTDLAGKPIRSQLFDNNKPVFKEQMNLKGLSAGMYLVNIKVGNQSLIRRIMIQ